MCRIHEGNRRFEFPAWYLYCCGIGWDFLFISPRYVSTKIEMTIHMCCVSLGQYQFFHFTVEDLSNNSSSIIFTSQLLPFWELEVSNSIQKGQTLPFPRYYQQI